MADAALKPALQTSDLSPGSTWEPLRDRTFRALWIASVASGIGTTMHDTAAAWSMTNLTTSPTLVTLMQTAASLPFFLFGLPAGAMADIVDRRKLMIYAQVAGTCFSVLLAIVSLMGGLSPAWLLSVAFLLGIGAAVAQPTWQAIVPEIIDRKVLPASVALNSIGLNVARMIGPALGGILVAAAGPAWVFLLNALSFVGLIVALASWKRPVNQASQNAEHVVGALVAAARYAAHSRPLRDTQRIPGRCAASLCERLHTSRLPSLRLLYCR